MEGHGDQGIEKGKTDQLTAAAPAAGNVMTATFAASAASTQATTVSGNEIMAIDDDTRAEVLNEYGAANASTGVNLQSAAAALNIVAAQLFVVNQNWDGLEAYLAQFLTEVQGDKFYSHPGIFCSIYQAQISYLIDKEQFVEARAVFDNKVKPLLDQEKNDAYKPFDLEARVEMLQNCVDNCLPLPADEIEDMDVVLSDYFMLYFPTSLQRKANRTNSISDFVMTFNDENGKRHRCLACQWVMPASATSQSVVHHIKHLEQVDHCRRATKWMLEHLTYVMGQNEIGMQDMNAASLGNQSRKRKAPPLTVSDPDQQSVVIPAEQVFEIWIDLCVANMKALFALKKPQSSAAAKAKEILIRQDELITELKRLFFSYMDEHVPLGSPLAFMKIKTLLNLADDLFPLLMNLPDVSELLLDQDKKVTELRRCFMVAASVSLPQTAPVDVITPSTDSSESISSKLPTHSTDSSQSRRPLY
ncbi:unnamed protein product [Urochloa humidicola]